MLPHQSSSPAGVWPGSRSVANYCNLVVDVSVDTVAILKLGWTTGVSCGDPSPSIQHQGTLTKPRLLGLSPHSAQAYLRKDLEGKVCPAQPLEPNRSVAMHSKRQSQANLDKIRDTLSPFVSVTPAPCKAATQRGFVGTCRNQASFAWAAALSACHVSQ